MLRGDLTINGNARMVTPEVKKALEKALAQELKAFSVELLNIPDVRRILMDSASELDDVTKIQQRSLQDGERFVVQFLATYRNEEDGVYGKQRINKNSAAAVQGVIQRMTNDLGVASAPLEISSLELEGTPNNHVVLIAGVSGAVVLFAVVIVVLVVRRRDAKSKEDKSVEKNGNKECEDKYVPQSVEGLVNENENDIDNAQKEDFERRCRMLAGESEVGKDKESNGESASDASSEDQDNERYHKDVGSKKGKVRLPESPSSSATMESGSSGEKRSKKDETSHSSRSRRQNSSTPKHDTSRDRRLGHKNASADLNDGQGSGQESGSEGAGMRKHRSGGESRSASPTKSRKHQKKEDE